MANKQVKEENSTYKIQYRTLKRRFKFLVYENECYQEELRNLQRKLLKLSRDKNFLLDRLQQFEKVSDSSDDSDATPQLQAEPMATDETKKNTKSKEGGGTKKKRVKVEKAADGSTKPTKSRTKKTPKVEQQSGIVADQSVVTFPLVSSASAVVNLLPTASAMIVNITVPAESPPTTVDIQ